MWVEVGNLYAKVLRATDEERDFLANYLTFPDASARFRGGDGHIRLLGMDGRFPAGLVSLVRLAAPKEGYAVEIANHAQATPHDPGADLDWLYDYQLEAVLAALRSKRGLLWLPTGSGKAELVVALVRAVPTEWLFLVHRTTLVEQTAERFARRNREHDVYLGEPGIIAEGTWTEGARLTLATFQSLDAALRRGDPRALALLGRVGGLAIDEAHTCAAGSFWRLAMATPKAAYRIGLSGTPLARGDRKSALVIAALGPVIYRIKAAPLIARGVLAKPTIRMVRVSQTSNRPTWQGVYGDLVVRGKKRNAALVAIVKTAEKPCFLFVKEVAHGKALEKALINAGVSAQFVWGSHSTEWRKDAVRALVAGRVDVIVCSVIFQEGIDVPSLRSVVVGSGGRSVIATIQRVGRGMRVEKNAAGTTIKDTFEVWDVLDEGQTWLERAAKERKRSYIQEGYTTSIIDHAPLA